MNPKRHTSKDIIIKMTKVKDKERILKAAREKQRITYKGIRQKLYKTKVSGMTYSKC